MFTMLLAAVLILCHCKAAILTAPDGSLLVVTVNPPVISPGGTATVNVMGYKATGTPVPDGTVIFFSCDLGSIEPSQETRGGRARVVFTAPANRSGTAVITVSSGGASVSPEGISIHIGTSATAALTLRAQPSTLPVGGGTSTLKVAAYDEDQNPLPNIPVTLSSTSGTLDSNGNTLYTGDDGSVEDGLHTTSTAEVTASSGNTDVSLTVTVTDNKTPTASFVFSPASPRVDQAVYFNASGSSDPDGTIGSYEWDFGDGGSGGGVSPSHTYRAAGTYTVVLTVRDNHGLSDSNSRTVTVGQGVSPTAAFVYSPTNPALNETIYFNASQSSDPDGTIESYHWDMGDGTALQGQTVTHAYTSAGSYSVLLTVTDDTGNTGNTGKTITLDETPNQAPTASFVYSPAAPVEGQTVHFNGSGSQDPDGTIADYQWDFGDGTGGTGGTVEHRFQSGGTYNVQLTVTDNGGKTASTSRPVNIGENQAPTASFVYSPSAPNAGERVYFNASASRDPDGTISAYRWDFGDGKRGSGEKVSHVYAAPGTYTVTLEVTDDGGKTGTANNSVVVN